jgi:hypothetical protein
MAELPRRRAPRTPFQPRFTLLMLYLFAFIFAFCFALAAPVVYEYFEIGSSGADGPQERAAMAEAMRQALRGRLWLAVVGATLALGIGIWTRALPGLRPPR